MLGSLVLVTVLASIGWWVVPVILRKMAMTQPLLAEDGTGGKAGEGSESIRP